MKSKIPRKVCFTHNNRNRQQRKNQLSLGSRESRKLIELRYHNRNWSRPNLETFILYLMSSIGKYRDWRKRRKIQLLSTDLTQTIMSPPCTLITKSRKQRKGTSLALWNWIKFDMLLIRRGWFIQTMSLNQ